MSGKSVPVAPLWGFFQHIRERSSIPLSLDQYFLLLEMLENQFPDNLTTREDLLSFTKLFWLNDQKFDSEFTYLFNSYINWDQWFEVTKTPKSGQESKEDNKIDSGLKTDKTEVDKTKEPDLLDKESHPVADPHSIEFELLLGDIQGGVNPAEYLQNLPDLGFLLADELIAPFKARKFVQRLRRKVETAEQVESDILDLPGMIADYTENGFIGDVIFEILDASYSNVVLLADKFGSMYSYEFIESHLHEAFRQIPHCNFQHYYFYNLPQETDNGLHYNLKSAIKGIPVLNTEGHHWSSRTWFFIFSDAGAHSGEVNKDRIRGSLKLWLYLRKISDHVHWLNPVPADLLKDTTAGRLEMRIPMIYPDEKTLNQLIVHSNPVK